MIDFEKEKKTMWLCLNNGFYSIVKDKSNPNMRVVRARRRGDLEKVLPNATVIEDAGTDYKFRVFVTKEEVDKLLLQANDDIDYTNFKSSTKRKDGGGILLHDAYLEFWNVMYALQTRLEEAERKKNTFSPFTTR